MFNRENFKSIVKKRGKTIKEVAEYLEISKVTLYRKMSGESDFYRDEIQKLAELLLIDDINTIFLQAKLRLRNICKGYRKII